ncbi:hypothetical protein YQE_11577, partial [Dendroctonus ponderosae]
MRLLFTLLYWESVIVGFSNRFCSCKYVEGTLKTNQNWAFLARFCFLSEEGQFEYVIDYKEDQGDINLLLYYDTDDQWPAVYKSAKTCEEREAVLNVQQNQLGIDLNYQLLMTNGPPGDYWREHFSADEFYILPILMGFSIAYSFLMLGITVCSLELKQRQLLHTTYKIFVLSCVLQLLGILLMSIAYLKMAVSGRESPKTKRVGKNRIDQQFPPTNQRLSGNMLLGASETCYLLLLLLLAKGFTITRGRLPLKGTVKLTIFMCVYVTTYLTIFVYEAVVFDPGEVLYLYESPAGYSLITLRLCGWAMFIYSTVFTLKRYPEKSNFYYPFNIFGTIWFVAGPAFVLSANAYIDKWVRESVVYAVLLFIAFGGHLMFLILTMPSVANKNFPYHVRTTQIGIMEVIGTAGTSSIEQFGHHAYEPSLGGREHTVIIPLTRRTEEIFEGGQCVIAKPQFPRFALQGCTIRRGFHGRKSPNCPTTWTWTMGKLLGML